MKKWHKANPIRAQNRLPLLTIWKSKVVVTELPEQRQNFICEGTNVDGFA